jgi:hypothetical protein
LSNRILIFISLETIVNLNSFMKKNITVIALGFTVLITSSAFVIASKTGIAGYTASPGELSCNACHGGGSSSASGTSITAEPAFTNDEYLPGFNYTITVDLAADGFNQYGFGCEILTGTNTNAGSMHTAGAGVKFLNAGARRNAVHTTAKTGTGAASFSFEWTAPTNGDAVTIYVAGNAVNGNNSTTLDFPMTPVSLALTPDNSTVGIREEKAAPGGVFIYPNPARSMTQVSYELGQASGVRIELLEISGKQIREFPVRQQGAGKYAQILDLEGITPGVYFLKIYGTGQASVQKLISVQ